MNEMCGNMIVLKDGSNGELCLVMSKRAYNGLTKNHLTTLENNYRIIASDISTIEKIGGGSARCMIAELF